MKLSLFIAGFLLTGIVGCSSAGLSAEIPSSQASDPNAPLPKSLPFTKDEFISVVSAFIAHTAADVKAQGYAVIFVDLGPESWEEHAPDNFKELVKKSSIKGV